MSVDIKEIWNTFFKNKNKKKMLRFSEICSYC